MAAKVDFLIEPRRGWQPVNFAELWNGRELLTYLAWRDIKVRYKQTALGGLWAILQPLIGTLIFGALFGRVNAIRTHDCPYPLFVYAGMLPWTFFSNALALSSNSLVGNEKLISKIYFPRLFVPMGPIVALLLDMLIGLALMAVLLVFYHWPLTWAILWLPLVIVGAVASVSGLGLLLSAWNVKYRDVRYAVPFFIQMLFFMTPVVYPLDYLPPALKPLLDLNPLTGVVEGARHALLGTPVAWQSIVLSGAVSAALLVFGAMTFRRMEKTFADLI